MPFKTSALDEVLTVFVSKEACSSLTQKGKLLPLASEGWNDVRAQVFSFIWIQPDGPITNFTIPFLPSHMKNLVRL